MIHKNSAIFVDFDGTLFSVTGELSPRTRAAIANTAKAGWEIIACTGRPVVRAVQYCRQLDIRYLIYCNGAGIYDVVQDKFLYTNPIKPDDVQKLSDAAKQFNTNMTFASDTQEYIMLNDRSDIGMKNLTIPMPGGTENLRPVITEPPPDVVMADLVHFDIDRLRAAKHHIEEHILPTSPELILVNESRALKNNPRPGQWWEYYYELGRLGTSKGLALEWLCKRLNIPLANTIAIGDSYNDIEMFKSCATSVAVANACQPLKDLATHITDDYKQDGVAKYLEKLIHYPSS